MKLVDLFLEDRNVRKVVKFVYYRWECKVMYLFRILCVYVKSYKIF